MYGAPKLPASYFTMFCVALVPPLWRNLMDQRLDAVEEARRTSMELPDWLRGQVASSNAWEVVAGSALADWRHVQKRPKGVD